MTATEKLQAAADFHAWAARMMWLQGQDDHGHVASAYKYQRWASEAQIKEERGQ